MAKSIINRSGLNSTFTTSCPHPLEVQENRAANNTGCIKIDYVPCTGPYNRLAFPLAKIGGKHVNHGRPYKIPRFKPSSADGSWTDYFLQPILDVLFPSCSPRGL